MKTFLDGEWRKLVMANYAFDPQVLAPYLPKNTELDIWEGTCYVSLVGFMFRNTRIKGMRIPFHSNFEEVNLRFYVRYHDNGEWKRGVVFIKEIVPKPSLTIVANAFYGENYETLPMSHSWEDNADHQIVAYRWKKLGEWHSVTVKASKESKIISAGSEAEFITEHYWGYTKLRGNRTSEYGVEHPRWETYAILDYDIAVDFAAVYGDDFGMLGKLAQKSVFLAEGSAIKVKHGRKI